MTAVLTRSDVPAQELTRARMRQAVHRLDPFTRLVCGYHLGWWDPHGAPADGGGKGVRPELVLLTTRAAGADPGQAVPAAVAVELVHNFSLVHDDIMDEDEYRRHRRTVWAQYGIPAAILAGDAMLALAGEVLAEAPSPTVSYAVRALEGTTRRLIAGQSADMAFETREHVGLQECLRMEADKTGALLACACSLGPLLADASATVTAGLAEFGEHLGVCFQLVDDLLGIWGEPERTGKPVGSDLTARKRSAPVVAALESGSAAGRELGRLYARADPLGQEQVTAAAGLVEAAGGRAWATARAAAELDRALAVLARLELADDDRHSLAGLAASLVDRDR